MLTSNILLISVLVVVVIVVTKLQSNNKKKKKRSTKIDLRINNLQMLCNMDLIEETNENCTFYTVKIPNKISWKLLDG